MMVVMMMSVNDDDDEESPSATVTLVIDLSITWYSVVAIACHRVLAPVTNVTIARDK
jgi:hypothetical protein